MPLVASPAPRRALVVVNPTAGTARTPLVDEVIERCRARLARVTVHRTAHRGDATGTVRAALAAGGEGPDLVVAVGGDGTVREVVQALVAAPPRARAAALAVVPAGTGNSDYRMLWGKAPWQESLEATLRAVPGRAERRRIDVGQLAETGALVLLGACSGLIAEGLVAARSIAVAGRERYARALPQAAAGFRPYPGRVTVDGRVLHEGATVLANVGGGRYRGGQYLILPRSELDDGLLDVCVVGAQVAAADVPELARAGVLHHRPGVVHGRGRRVVVERLDGRPLCFEHDGELQPRTWTSMTVQVLAGVLPVWGAATKEVTRVHTPPALPLGGLAAT
ncbi:diacylglycerol/lipid kinase family protein [Streptomyces longispororuber]|uniref:diacylglycerol/lipid kinase family protein n=1 Tax=Streptomyces longispororuber TaxID=68230 RepID=UPI0036F83264